VTCVGDREGSEVDAAVVQVHVLMAYQLFSLGKEKLVLYREVVMSSK
jgi:hypothetical protein